MKIARTAQRVSRGRFASTLVIAEHNGETVTPSTLSCLTAASKIGGDVSVLISGKNIGNVASSASNIAGVSKILTVDNDAFENPVGEDMANIVKGLAGQYTHVLTPSSNAGKSFIPRVAATMDSSPLSDVMEVVDESTFKRPTYAGNAIATVRMSDPVKFILTRSTAFDKASEEGGSASVEAVTDAASPAGLSQFVSASESSSERPDLTAARVVISGGRGMKNGENFGMLEALADKLGGAVGASRAAVDAGFVPNEYQVGQTGKVVAPDLYVAVGISGAIQHLSGMKDSKVIVAVNKDKEAPIFQVADYGIVDDLFKVVPEMNEKM